MKSSTLEEFRAALRATGGYDTDAAHLAAKRARPGWHATASYTWDLMSVFPKCAVLELLGTLTTEKWAHFCYRSISGAERLGVKVHFEGWKNREAYDGPVMYLCNHMSTIETLMLAPVVLTYGPFNVVAKASLAHMPFLEKAAAHMGMIPIGRKSPREDLVNMLRVGTERIKAGNSFLIFPQGSREKVFSRKVYSSIGAKLAEKAGCPICPVVVDTRLQPTRERGLLRHFFKDFGTVDTAFDIRCACGPIIPCTKAKEMHERTFEWMAAKLESWNLPTEH